MTTKKKILIIFAILASIALIFALLTKVDQEKDLSTIEKSIKTARQTAMKQSDQKVSAAIGILTSTGVIDKEIASSKQDECFMAHHDQGWVIANWYQECQLIYTNIFSTTLSKDEVTQKLLADPRTQEIFGVEDATAAYHSDEYCGIFEHKYISTLFYRAANVTGKEYSCTIPKPLPDNNAKNEPVEFDNQHTVNTYKTYDVNVINKELNLIWIVFDENYYFEDLGCEKGGLLCKNPRSKPVHPSI